MAKPDFLIHCPGCRWVHDSVRITLSPPIDDEQPKKMLIEFVWKCHAPKVVLPYLKNGFEPFWPPYRGQFVEKEDTCFAAEPKRRRSKRHSIYS